MNRRLERNKENNFTLEGRIVKAFPYLPPTIVSLNPSGPKFCQIRDFSKREKFISDELLRIIDEKSAEIGADGYEAGEHFEVWRGDAEYPGSSRYVSRPVQFYRLII